jgi:hypothetical protein
LKILINTDDRLRRKDITEVQSRINVLLLEQLTRLKARINRLRVNSIDLIQLNKLAIELIQALGMREKSL